MLYTYRDVASVPEGIAVLDAREILPEGRMLRYVENGSFALGSDIFRLELQRRGLGYWIDADVYFVKQLERCDESYVFGWEDEKYICQAVLHIPKDARLLHDLLDFVNAEVVVPPWWPPEDQRHQRYLAACGHQIQLARMPWATTGPKAITHFVKSNDLTSHALPADVFYPVHWKDADDLFKPRGDIWQRLTRRTRAVHLWNHLVEDQKRRIPPPSSFIDEICKLQGIDCSDLPGCP